MKRPISILLLAVFLFNIAGYHVLFMALRYQARQEIVHHLDDNIPSDDGTITLKIPMALPYQTDWASYERVDGNFEHRGEYYRLVKQRLQHDTLYVVCIKDLKEKQLVTAMTQFSQLVHDLPGNAATLKLIGSFQKEYHTDSPLAVVVDRQGWCLHHNYGHTAFSLLRQESTIFSPPPDFIG